MEEGLLTPSEVEEVVVSEFNPVRVAFEGVAEIVTRDILNCGVSPRKLLEVLKRRFLDAGGYSPPLTHLRTSRLCFWNKGAGFHQLRQI